MSTFGDTDLTDEQIIRGYGRKIAPVIIEKTDPETLERREAREKAELEAHQRDWEQSLQIFKENEIRRQQMYKANRERDLRNRGWTKWGWPEPNQKFYNIELCHFCKQEEVAYIDVKSPNVSHEDSYEFGYDVSQGPDSSKNYVKPHKCKQVSAEQVNFLVDKVAELQITIRELLKSRSGTHYMPVG